MSVLACVRGDCPNIMCSYYSHNYGYLCNDCMRELQELQPDNIRTFLESDVNTNPSMPPRDWYEEFRND